MPPLRKILIQAILPVLATFPISAQTPSAKQEVMPSVDQIVDHMREHETYQSKELQHYEAVRHYQVEYKGLVSISGKMDVAITYDAASGKSFRILSQSGSKLLCDKVLKRAVESEKEASREKQATALSPKNYRFRLTGMERIDGRPAYVLQVDPLRAGKFLYRGTIWVDAAQYAVDKIEVQPARNPSLWISSTEIENTNAETEGIWLPQSNRSESKIRIGGTAVLTIDYGIYRIALARQAQTQNPEPHTVKPNITEAASSR